MFPTPPLTCKYKTLMIAIRKGMTDVVVVTQVISKLDPGESVTISWDQKDNNGNHVKSGTYVAIVNGITSEEQVSKTTFTIKA